MMGIEENARILLRVPSEDEADAFIADFGITIEFLILALVAEGQRVDPGDDSVLMVRALLALASDRHRQGRPVQPELQELVELWLDRCTPVLCGLEEKPDIAAAATTDEPVAAPESGRPDDGDGDREEHQVEEQHAGDVAREHHVERVDDRPALCEPASATPGPAGGDLVRQFSVGVGRAVALHQGQDGHWHYALVDPDGQLRIGKLDSRFLADRTTVDAVEASAYPAFNAVTMRLARDWEAGLHLAVISVAEGDADDLVPVRVATGQVIMQESTWDTIDHVELDVTDVLDYLGLPGANRADAGVRADVVNEVNRLAGMELADNQFDQAWVVGLLLTYAVGVAGQVIPVRAAPPPPSTSRVIGRDQDEETTRGSDGWVPGPFLSVTDLTRYLGISRSSVARLKKQIPSIKTPGVGIRFRRADVDQYLCEHLVAPKAPAVVRPRSGMRLASSDDEEIQPGLTRGELKRRAGF